MKILISSQHFYPENFRVNDIVESLSKLGYDITVITGKPNYPEGKIYPGYEQFGVQRDNFIGCNIFRLPVFLRGRGSAVRLALNYLSYILSGIFLAPLYLRRKNFDVVFCYATSPFLQVIPAIFLAYIKKSKLVVNVQDLWPESLSATNYISNKFILFLVGKIVQFIYKKSDLLLVQSEGFKDRISRFNPDAKIIYWPNSVPDFFSENIAVSGLNKKDSSKFTVLFAGNLGIAQSLETIVEAATLLLDINPDVEIIIAGNGSQATWLANEIKLRNLINMKMLGRLPQESMPALMRKSSALLVCLANKEIFNLTIPNKVQAYMAIGKPIVGSIGGEGAKIIEESKSGIVSSPEDYVGLAYAISSMAKSGADELLLYGMNGRDYFEKNFNHNKLIIDLVTYFRNISGLD